MKTNSYKQLKKRINNYINYNKTNEIRKHLNKLNRI